MLKFIAAITLLFVSAAAAQEAPAHAKIETSEGDIIVELYPQQLQIFCAMRARGYMTARCFIAW